jgi:hypothetical protein
VKIRYIPLEDAPDTRGRVEQWGVLPAVAERVLTTGEVAEIEFDNGTTPLRAKQAADAFVRRRLKKGRHPELAHIRTARSSHMSNKIYVRPRDASLAFKVRDAIKSGQDARVAELLRGVFPEGLPVSGIKAAE